MKNIVYHIPENEMIEFALLIWEWKLNASIIGITDNEDMIALKVEYNPYEHGQALLEIDMNLINGYSVDDD